MTVRTPSALDELFPTIARVVFHEMAEARVKLHAVRGALRCDAVFRLRAGFHVSGTCPCVDDYVDAFCEVWRYLRGLDPAVVGDYAAAARKHCRLRVVGDVQRRRRGRNSQQRTDRLPRGAIGRALRSDEQRALLVDVVSEAGSAAPLDGEDQLMLRLATLRARRRGGTPEQHLDGIREDLAQVQAAAVEHGQRKRDTYGMPISWWEYSVETGLGRRPRLSSLPVGTSVSDHGAELDLPDPAAARAIDAVTDSDACHDHIVAELVAAASRPDPARAVRERLTDLADRGTIPRAVAHRALTAPGRLADIVRAARGLGPVRDCPRDRGPRGTGIRTAGRDRGE